MSTLTFKQRVIKSLVLERWIFYLLIFSIPVQGRLILFEWTKPLAQHFLPLEKGAGLNQWTSAYLYGTDILLAAIFLLWVPRALRAAKISGSQFLSLIRANRRIDKKYFVDFLARNSKFFLTLFFIVAISSIFNAQIKGLAWYQLLKLVEFVGFYLYLKANLGKVFSFQKALMIIVASGLVQSILGIIQYLKQGSVGLHFLGESPLSIDATGVAVFIADGAKYLRAYGLAPHPNILAVWLFAAVFATYFLYLYKNNIGTSQVLRTCEVGRLKNNWLLFLGYPVLLFGLFFTFSRVIIGLWVLGVLARLFIVFLRKEFRDNQTIRQRTIQLTVASLIVTAIFSASFWPQVKSRLAVSPNEEAVTQRVFYNKAATQITEDNPWLGVGLGQFVPEMMDKFRRLPAQAYQPVHNIYLLIASETGFLGLGVFLAFLFSIFWQFIRTANFSKLRNFSFLIFAFSFLIIGLFDHFLWTSQQGSLLFWMSLALLSTPTTMADKA